MLLLHRGEILHGWSMPVTSHCTGRGGISHLDLPRPWLLTQRRPLRPLLRRKFIGSLWCKANGVGDVEADIESLKKRGSELVDDLKGTCIYLVGMMGSGKSLIGEALAKSLGYHFFDSDKLIEQAAGGTIVSQLMEEEEEDSFRDAETEVLKQLSCMGRLVVATSGGMVLRPMNWSYLRHGITVFLDVPVDTLAAQFVGAGVKSRPLLAGPVTTGLSESQALDKLASILKVRRPFYEDSDAKVSLQKMASEMGSEDLNSITPAMVALEVLEEINKLFVKHRR